MSFFPPPFPKIVIARLILHCRMLVTRLNTKQTRAKNGI